MEPENVDDDPVIPKAIQEDIFAMVWDMGIIQHKGSPFDGMVFLPKIRDHNPFLDESKFEVKIVSEKVGDGLYYVGTETLEADANILLVQGLWASTVSAQRQQESIDVCNNYLLRSHYTTASVFVLGTGSLASKINCYAPCNEADQNACERLANEPNAEMTWSHWTPVVKTLKKIKKNEQLLIDYGPIYEWKPRQGFAGPTWNLSLVPPAHGYLPPPPRPQDNQEPVQGLIGTD